MQDDPAALLATVTEQLLDAARQAGADAADAIAVAGRSVVVEMRDGRLEHAEGAEGVDIGLRVLIGQQQACVSAADISPATIATLAERAVAMAREAPPDPAVGLADPEQLASERDAVALDLVDREALPDPASLQEQAQRVAAAAQAHAGISQVDSASASWSHSHVHLAASNGFSGGYARTGHALSCVAITGSGTGMERDYAAESRIHRTDLPPPEQVGDLAAQRTLAHAGARQPPTGSYPVLYDERIAASLIGHLLAAINGTAITRGASFLREALDTAVLPAGIDLIADPHRPRIAGSRPFDGEGLPTQRRALVADGVLQGWVLDLATGRKLDLPSTGDASRGTGGPPAPAAGNVTLTQGTASHADLLRDMGTGLWVTGLIGATINPNTGDYSRGASGFWVENGVITGPVNECTIAGNLRDMLARIIPANDARPHLGVMVPSLLVEGMTIAGA